MQKHFNKVDTTNKTLKSVSLGFFNKKLVKLN